jgi:hypothetical protein
MPYIVPKTLNWPPSPDEATDVVSYNVYWAIPPATLNKTAPNLNPNFLNVGKVNKIALPLAGMPQVDGNLEIGVAPVDDVGNIGDIVSDIFPFDFKPPAPCGKPFLT